MINYIELGIGLHEHLASEGVILEQAQSGEWQANASDERVNNLIASYNPWAVEKAKKLSEINEWLEDQLQLVVAGIPDSEQKSWPTQVDEAYGKRPLRMLIRIAAARGVSTDELIAKVKANAEAYDDRYGELQGLRDKAKQLIKSMPDSGEFNRLPELWAIKCTG